MKIFVVSCLILGLLVLSGCGHHHHRGKKAVVVKPHGVAPAAVVVYSKPKPGKRCWRKNGYWHCHR